jgi:hypothetical protein
MTASRRLAPRPAGQSIGTSQQGVHLMNRILGIRLSTIVLLATMLAGSGLALARDDLAASGGG